MDSIRKEEASAPNAYPDYSSRKYWDTRYTREKGLSFDWLQPYESIREIIITALKGDHEAEILIIGCGNSQLSEKLYEEGYRYITNIDFSSTVIEEMKLRHQHYEDIDYQCMDIRSLDVDPNSFQCIIDKAALDCVFCSQDTAESVNKALEEVYRVLAPGGTYLCFSHGEPLVRGPFFQNIAGWKLSTDKLKKPAIVSEGAPYHYVYILNKDE